MTVRRAFPVHIRSTIPDGIVQEIRRRIEGGEVKEGDRLPSVEVLAANFGVSRASVREALHALEALQLVDVRHGKGTYVRARTMRSSEAARWIEEQQYALQELSELRLAVETTAARLASIKATDDELDVIDDCAVNLRLAGDDLGKMVEEDSRFHDLIIRAARNRLLEQSLALSSEYLAEARHRMPRVSDEASITAEAHDRIVDALRRRDPAAAATAMREHLRSVEEGLGIYLP